MRVPTLPANKAKIESIFIELEETMSDLYCRWQDEKDYEDIKDYAKPIRPILAKVEINFRKMTKRPFGFEFDFGGDAIYSIFLTVNKYGWKRIA